MSVSATSEIQTEGETMQTETQEQNQAPQAPELTPEQIAYMERQTFLAEKLGPIVRPDILQMMADRGIVFAVMVPEEVTKEHIEDILRDDANICASRSFGGWIEGEGFRRYSSVFEDKFNLGKEPDKFVEFIHGVVMTERREKVVFDDFMMSIEIFDTDRDPNWSFPLIQFNVRSAEINCTRYLQHVKA
jgi:hypothetical protein